MSSDFFELWVGVGACNRTELWTAGWELVRGEQRCKSRGHVRNRKGQVEAQDSFQLSYRYLICENRLYFPENPTWSSNKIRCKVLDFQDLSNLQCSLQSFLSSFSKSISTLRCWRLLRCRELVYLAGLENLKRLTSKPLPGLPWLSLLIVKSSNPQLVRLFIDIRS